MKKCIILLLSCFLFMPSCLRAYTDSNPFRMVYPIFKDSILNTYINKSDTIDLSNLSNDINGLSLDCKIYQISENSFVRILLEDSIGSNYIILENNRLRNSNDTVIFTEYCEETASLNNIKPKRIKLYIKDATILLEKIRYTEVSSNSNLDYGVESINSDSIKKWQTIKIVDEINKYNQENNKLWVAGVTNVSLMDYDAKKRVLGISDDVCDTKGLEYYVDGIFEIGETDSIDYSTNDTIESANSPYVESFDWRNRHGKNWMTPCKDQGGSGYCVAFAINGVLEALVNLQYNKKLDIDLSEQDIVFTYARANYQTSVTTIYKKGMHSHTAMLRLKQNGIADELSVPFVDNPSVLVPPERVESLECLSFRNFEEVFYYEKLTDRIKSDLINHGPLVSGIETENIRHEMALVGYNTIKEGDTINHITTSYNEYNIIKKGDSRIGKTYWIFKNSYGEDEFRDGYIYILFNNNSAMAKPYYIMTPLICKLYSDDDIVCSDNDGDGYYFWGLGERPSNLPDWAPIAKDGDDSNAKYGPSNYGHLIELNPNNRDTIFINEPTVWNNENYIWQHVVIRKGATLNVSSKIKFYKGVNVLIENSGKLIIDGGELENVNIKVSSGGYLCLNSKGKIKKYKNFHTAKGAIVKIINGIIY